MSDMADTANKTVIDRCCAIVSVCGIAFSIWLVLLSHMATAPLREMKIGLFIVLAGLIPVIIQFGRHLRPWQGWSIEKGVQEHRRELRQWFPRWARLLEWAVYAYPVLLLLEGFVDPSARVSRQPQTTQERIMGFRVASAITLALYYNMGLIFFFVPRSAKPVDFSSRGVGDV
jgi:hypothetical protein